MGNLILIDNYRQQRKHKELLKDDMFFVCHLGCPDLHENGKDCVAPTGACSLGAKLYHELQSLIDGASSISEAQRALEQYVEVRKNSEGIVTTRWPFAKEEGDDVSLVR